VTTDPERRDLLNALDRHRTLLRVTTRRLTDEQARQRTTVSELCIGGIIKHVAITEGHWDDFIEHGASAFRPAGEMSADVRAGTLRMEDGETLAALLDRYDAVAQRTTELVTSLYSLNASHPLPEAPWFPPGTAWSARRVLLHVIAETAQHAGHADIIREALDGRKSMG
jgi:uncharacterized damage-inducible protein DinB